MDFLNSQENRPEFRETRGVMNPLTTAMLPLLPSLIEDQVQMEWTGSCACSPQGRLRRGRPQVPGGCSKLLLQHAVRQHLCAS